MRERIKEIIEREGMAQSQFADYIGVNRPTLSHILAGRNNPSMEVVMKIHHKFPKINVLWLLDGVGAYDGDAVADYPQASWRENRMAEFASETLQEDSSICEQSATAPLTSQPQARFYQGELFAENAVFAAESAGTPKNRKEMPLQMPPKAPYQTDNQVECTKKIVQRKIAEIKVFYDDGTYETFKP